MNNCIMNSDSFNSLCQVYRNGPREQTEQRLIINALSLMSERLNLMQRILSELYERLVRRP